MRGEEAEPYEVMFRIKIGAGQPTGRPPCARRGDSGDKKMRPNGHS